MEFREPKFELIYINTKQVVYASNGCTTGETKCEDGYTYGYQDCGGSVPTGGCSSDFQAEMQS